MAWDWRNRPDEQERRYVRPGGVAEPAGQRRIRGREQQLSDALVASGELVLLDRRGTR